MQLQKVAYSFFRLLEWGAESILTEVILDPGFGARLL